MLQAFFLRLIPRNVNVFLPLNSHHVPRMRASAKLGHSARVGGKMPQRNCDDGLGSLPLFR